MKRIIAWSLVTVILTATLIFALFNVKGSSFWKFDMDLGNISYRYPDEDKYNKGNTTLTREQLNGVDTLDIDWIDGDIEVISYDGDTVELYESSSKTLNDDTVMRWRVHDGEICVKYFKSRFIFALFSKNTTNLNKKLTVKVPADMIAEVKIEAVSTNISLNLQYELSDVDIETVSGNIMLNGIQVKSGADNEIDVSTTSGKTELYNCRSSKLKCESVSGDVTVDGIFDGETKISAVSGKLELDGIFKELDCSTVSGNITVRYDSDSLEDYKECFGSLGKCSVETVSGNARLICHEFPYGFVADMNTVSGKFSSDFAASSSNNKYTHGQGGFKIDFESVSGDLKINEN